MNALVAVILAGGAGTRFWPASTQALPKQFLRLTGERSLLQLSYDRVKDLIPPELVFVVTAEQFIAAVREHLPELPAGNIIGEPMRRDTAAAVALATLLVHERCGPCTITVLTADHLIGPTNAFHGALLSAAGSASRGESVYTFGIPPSSPATGYGYLEVGDQLCLHGGIGHHAVRSFHEKPDGATAERYLASGRFLWNSGMFVFHSGLMRDLLLHHLPLHVAALTPVVQAPQLSTLAAAFAPLPLLSFDKGVMEKLHNTMCVRANFHWSDVGGFSALAAHLPRDGFGNAARGQLRSKEAMGNVVWCEDDSEVVALVGVENLIVVRAGRRTLIVPLDRAEEIKALVASLASSEQ